jgi:hypothetical protein
MHFAGGIGAADQSIGPSARKERGPQDDRGLSAEQILLCNFLNNSVHQKFTHL